MACMCSMMCSYRVFIAVCVGVAVFCGMVVKARASL